MPLRNSDLHGCRRSYIQCGVSLRELQVSELFLVADTMNGTCKGLVSSAASRVSQDPLALFRYPGTEIRYQQFKQETWRLNIPLRLHLP